MFFFSSKLCNRVFQQADLLVGVRVNQICYTSHKLYGFYLGQFFW